MSHHYPLILLGLIALILITSILVGFGFGRTSSHYEKKRLLTDHELAFYPKLTKAAARMGGYTVMTQVSMGAFIATRPGLSDNTRRNAWNSICQKIVDFVVIDQKSNVILVVELDDKTHNYDKDRLRDSLVGSAGYKTVRFTNGFKITINEIEQKLRSAI